MNYEEERAYWKNNEPWFDKTRIVSQIKHYVKELDEYYTQYRKKGESTEHNYKQTQLVSQIKYYVNELRKYYVVPNKYAFRSDFEYERNIKDQAILKVLYGAEKSDALMAEQFNNSVKEFYQIGEGIISNKHIDANTREAQSVNFQNVIKKIGELETLLYSSVNSK